MPTIAARTIQEPVSSVKFHLIVGASYEGMPMPETYKFNGQEFKMNVKGVEEVPMEWGGKLVL